MPFEPRDLPTAVFLGDEVVAGPFCVHCGYPLTMHSDELLCPKLANRILGPACSCHRIEPREVTMLVPPPTGRGRRVRITRERLEIVPVQAAR